MIAKIQSDVMQLSMKRLIRMFIRLHARSAVQPQLLKTNFPELMAKNIVGVQATTEPVGLAYAMRFIYRDEMELYNELV